MYRQDELTELNATEYYRVHEPGSEALYVPATGCPTPELLQNLAEEYVRGFYQPGAICIYIAKGHFDSEGVWHETDHYPHRHVLVPFPCPPCTHEHQWEPDYAVGRELGVHYTYRCAFCNTQKHERPENTACGEVVYLTTYSAN